MNTAVSHLALRLGPAGVEDVEALSPEPGGSARCYWNRYGTQCDHPASKGSPGHQRAVVRLCVRGPLQLPPLPLPGQHVVLQPGQHVLQRQLVSLQLHYVVLDRGLLQL